MRGSTLLWMLLITTCLATSSCIGSAQPTLKCASDDDCLDSGTDGVSYACDKTAGICLRSCTAATEAQDCLASQECDVAPGDTTGLCREGSSSSGDPGAGDPGAGDPGAGDPGSGD